MIKISGVYFSSVDTVGCVCGKKTNQFSVLPASVAASVIKIIEYEKFLFVLVALCSGIVAAGRNIR